MTEQPLHVIHHAPNLGRSSFGIASVALPLAREQRRLGLEAHVWSGNSPEEQAWAVEAHGIDPCALLTFEVFGPRRLGFMPGMLRHGLRTLGPRTIVHQHGIWQANSWVTRRLGRRDGVRTVLSPHGSLATVPLQKSPRIKAVAGLLYEQRNLHGASGIHVLSEDELKDVRSWGIKSPAAIIPNGVDTFWIENRVRCDTGFRERYKIEPSKRILLYLSRISPIKNVLGLLDAFASCKRQAPDWVLILAGADEFSHLDVVQDHLRTLDLSSEVVVTGPLFGEDKLAAFDACEAFVLPSFSEGAPVVILEALGRGKPVLATHASPWPQLVTEGMGWHVSAEPYSLADALRQLMASDSVTLATMGQRGLDHVGRHFLWERIAAQMCDFYRFLLGEVPRPSFVVLD